MKILVRPLLVIIVLAFAVGSVVHGVEASAMSVKMSAASGGMAPGCDGCGGENGDKGKVERACSSLCVTPAIAVLPTIIPIAVRVSETIGLHVAELIVGQSGPPDPHPPRPALN
ncbi:MAG: hypothetical protein AB7P12_08995 [Alphaproteobacteria bacterium]